MAFALAVLGIWGLAFAVWVLREDHREWRGDFGNDLHAMRAEIERMRAVIEPERVKVPRQPSIYPGDSIFDDDDVRWGSRTTWPPLDPGSDWHMGEAPVVRSSSVFTITADEYGHMIVSEEE